MKTADVVIIGGGCMGASVAYHLTRLGITDVVLIEREPALGAGSTGRNAGGVRHQFSHEANVRLSIESIRLFEHFEDEIGYPLDFYQDGYLFLLASLANVDSFARGIEVQTKLGVDVAWLDPGDVVRYAPGVVVDDIRAATFCARDGIADPHGVTQGFANAARRAGMELWLDTTVTGIRLDRDEVAGVETSRGDIATRTVVNAAGPWAKAIGALAGVTLPIEPLRRHIFIAQPPSAQGWERAGVRTAPASRIMVIDFETTFYFHREGPNLLFGMGDPDEVTGGYDTTVDWDILEKVEPVATRRLPVLADAQITHAWAGLYEVTPDALPIIGPAGAVAGLYIIGGFSGHGFMHAPAAGRVVADLIAGRDPGTVAAPFAFDRFSAAGEHGALAVETNVV